MKMFTNKNYKYTHAQPLIIQLWKVIQSIMSLGISLIPYPSSDIFVTKVFNLSDKALCLGEI